MPTPPTETTHPRPKPVTTAEAITQARADAEAFFGSETYAIKAANADRLMAWGAEDPNIVVPALFQGLLDVTAAENCSPEIEAEIFGDLETRPARPTVARWLEDKYGLITTSSVKKLQRRFNEDALSQARRIEAEQDPTEEGAAPCLNPLLVLASDLVGEAERGNKVPAGASKGLGYLLSEQCHSDNDLAIGRQAWNALYDHHKNTELVEQKADR
jgi:hypothetical protein